MTVQTFGGLPVQPAQTSRADYTLTEQLTLVWPFSFLESGNVVASNMYVQGPQYAVILPDATQASPGTSFIFNNIGANDIPVLDAAEGTIKLTEAGISYYFCLATNTTPAGTWNFTKLGATGSAADAFVLAGYGLVGDDTNFSPAALDTNIITASITTDPYDIIASNRSQLLVVASGASTQTINLNTNPLPAGLYFQVNNQNSFPFVLDAAPGTIDGAPTLPVLPGASLIVVYAGTNIWNTVGGDASASSTFETIDYPLTGAPSSITLDPATYGADVINFIGAPTGDIIIYFPAQDDEWIVTNQTTGGFSITIQMTDGSGGGVGSVLPILTNTRMNYLADSSAQTLYVVPTGLSFAQGGTYGMDLNSLITSNGTIPIQIPSPAPDDGKILTIVGDLSASLAWYGVSNLVFAPTFTGVQSGPSASVSYITPAVTRQSTVTEITLQGSVAWGADAGTEVTIVLAQVTPVAGALYTVAVMTSQANSSLYSTPILFSDAFGTTLGDYSFSVTVTGASNVYLNRSADGTNAGLTSMWVTEAFRNA